MLRGLIHYWRVNAAVLLAAAVTTAVLAGALLVGDSVRNSLRQLTLDRLGRIDSAMVTQRFFRESLAADLAADPTRLAGAAPAILLRGSAVLPDSGARASQVSVLGVDARFTDLFGAPEGLDFTRGEGQIFPSVILNEPLAGELGTAVGDAVMLSFGRWSEVPRGTLIGDTDPEDVLETVRLTVSGIVPDRGLGRFGITARQTNPMNAFVELGRLQRELDRRDQVNAVLVAHADPPEAPDSVLESALALEDLGLRILRNKDSLAVESVEMVLRPDLDHAIREAVAGLRAAQLPVQSYLANWIRHGERSAPYSSIAALDPSSQPGPFSMPLADGGTAAPIGPDGILLNAWLADDLNAQVGDEIELGYFVVGAREELSVETSTFEVRGIVSMRGLAADRTLTPEYPGLQGADDIADWDPPFPVDLDRIRPKDEDYWDDFGATPKAFVSAETGRRLWSTRFGSTTSIRIAPAPGESPETTESRLRDALGEALSAETFGFRFRDVKAEGLAASAGATDFGGLFIGFSLFLIVSSALLVGLLFGLGVEQRASQVGLLLAVGYPIGAVRRQLLAEGGLIAAVGALLGLAAAVGYGALMMAALRTLWRAAVGSSQLFLHVKPASLAIGWVIAMSVILLSIFLSIRRLRKIAVPRLLTGDLKTTGRSGRGRLARILAYGGAAGALLLVAYALASGTLESPALAFGSGTSLLISGLGFFALWCRGSRRRDLAFGARAPLAGMAARNSAWVPGRSILSVALVATASFMIVAVGANRQEYGDELLEKDSGSGGFSLLAESDIPLHQDLETNEGREELGLSEDAWQNLGAPAVYPLRLLPGDDTSCLNLYRPERPRLLGLPPEMIARGGFGFQQHVDLPQGADGPWRLLETELEPGVVPVVGDYNSAMWILKLGLGDELAMQNEFGETFRLRLVGMLETSIFQSELLISERAFLEHFPSQAGYGYFLIDAAPDQQQAVAATLEKALEPFGFDATATREKLAAFKEVEHTYLATFQMLGALGLLLGTVGLGIVLVRNLIERRGELATLRAFGFRRSSLAWIVLAENVLLLVVGMLVGSLSALVAVAPRLATVHVPWASLSFTLAFVLVVGMLSSVVAVLGSLRVPLLPALKSER